MSGSLLVCGNALRRQRLSHWTGFRAALQVRAQTAVTSLTLTVCARAPAQPRASRGLRSYCAASYR